MATQVQFRGGTTTETNAFTGAAREVTVDTTKDTVVVHDGSTQGGFPLLRAEGGAQNISTTGKVTTTGIDNSGLFNIKPGGEFFKFENNSAWHLTYAHATLQQTHYAIDANKTYTRLYGGEPASADDWSLQATSSGVDVTGTLDVSGDITVNTDAFFVDASAKSVGIGTGSSPIGAFEIKSTEGNKAYFRDATSNNTVLAIQADDTSARILSTYQNAGGGYKPLAFHTAGSERMQINSSGSVLIGPAGSPATTITSAGAITTAGALTLNGSGGSNAWMAYDGGTCKAQVTHDGTYRAGSISGANANILLTGSTGAATFAGVVSADAGIDFSGISSTAANGSVDNNLLDDYEEGTFTPTLTKWSPGNMSGVSYTIQQGRYIKIGAVVHARINLLVDAGITWGTSSNALTVDGLPFSYGTVNTVVYRGYFRYVNSSTNYYPTDFQWYGYGTKIYGVIASTGSVWDTTFDGLTQVCVEFTYTTLSH